MSSYQRMKDRDSKKGSTITSELGTVTSSGKEISAEGAGEYREVSLIAPFGIRWNPPSGTDVELIKNWGSGSSVVAVGTIVDEEVEPGEIELYSQGGATITLKNNGDVVINGCLTITKDGQMNTSMADGE